MRNYSDMDEISLGPFRHVFLMVCEDTFYSQRELFDRYNTGKSIYLFKPVSLLEINTINDLLLYFRSENIKRYNPREISHYLVERILNHTSMKGVSSLIQGFVRVPSADHSYRFIEDLLFVDWKDMNISDFIKVNIPFRLEAHITEVFKDIGTPGFLPFTPDESSHISMVQDYLMKKLGIIIYDQHRLLINNSLRILLSNK